MPGFLLQDDAVEARKNVFDDWLDEQKRTAQQATQQAAQTVQTTAQNLGGAVQSAVQPISDEVLQRRQVFDDWASQQRPPVQPVAEPAPATDTAAGLAPPDLTQPTPTVSSAPSTPEAQQRSSAFDDWLNQRAQPVQQAVQAAAAPVVDALQSAGQANSGAALMTPPPGNDTGASVSAPDAQSTQGGPSGQQWLQIAEAQLSKPYIWGSKGGRSDFSQDPAGFDCSGFVSYVMKTGFGVDLPAFTGSAYKQTRALGPNEQPRPGDVVFYNMDSGDPHEQHIALYIGNGQIIQAGGTRHDVNKTSANQAVGSAPEYRRPTALDTPRGNAMAQSVVGSVAQTASDAATSAGTAVQTIGQGKDAFIDSLSGLAQQASQKTGIDPSVYLAIAANETGWGRSKTAQEQNNLFSIQGSNAGGRWAGYDSPKAAFDAFNNLISSAPRYAQAWADRGDPGRFINDLRQAGYVVDEPGYPAQGWVDQVNSIRQDLSSRVGGARTGQDFLGTLGQGAQSVADRAQGLADQSTALAQESARRAQQAQDLLNTTRQNISAENDRYFQQRQQERQRQIADLLEPRQFNLSMAENQPAGGGFQAPDLSSLLRGPAPGESPHPMPGRPGGLITPPGTYNPAPGSIGAALSDALGSAIEPLQQPLQQARTSFLDTLAQNAQATADRARQLADQSAQLASTTGQGLQEAPGRIQQTLQDLGARSEADQRAQQSLLDRLLQAPEAAVAALPETLESRRAAGAGFTAPAANVLDQVGNFVAPIGDFARRQQEFARQTYTAAGLPPPAELDLTKPLGPQVGIDPYGQIVEQGVPQIIRGVQQGSVGDVAGGALQTLLGAASALPGAGGGAGRAGPAARELAEEAIAADIGAGQTPPRIAQAIQDLVRSRQGTGAVDALGDVLGTRQAGSIDPIFAARLGAGAAGGLAGNLTTPEEANPLERALRIGAGAAAGAAVPSVAEFRGNPAIAQAVLENLRRGGLSTATYTPTARGAIGTAVDLSKQGMLSNPVGRIGDTIGNVIELLRSPAALALGGRPSDAAAGLMAVARAIPEAGRNAAMALGGRQLPTLGTGAATIGRRAPIYRLLSAADMFTRTLAEYQGMAERASALLRDAGLRADDAGAPQFLANHAQQLYEAGARSGGQSVMQAVRDAQSGLPFLDNMFHSYAVWKESMLNSPRLRDQALGALADFQIPFAGVPVRLLQVGVNRLPGPAQATGAVRAIRALVRNDIPEAQRAIGQTALESMIQVQIMNGIREGNIVGPDDPDHPGGAMRVAGQWYSFNDLGAYALPIQIMAGFAEAAEKAGQSQPYNSEWEQKAAQTAAGLNASLKPFADAVPGQQLVHMLGALGQGGATGALQQQLQDSIARVTSPGAGKFLEDLMDPLARDVQKKGVQSLWEYPQSRIPGLAQRLPAKLDPTTGEPLEKRRSGAGILVGMETLTPSELTTEINRLKKKGEPVSVPQAPETLSYKGAKVQLTPDEKRAITRVTGGQLAELADRTLGSREYQQADDKTKARLIGRMLSRAENNRFSAWVEAVGYDEARRRLDIGRRPYAAPARVLPPVLSVLEQEAARSA